MGIDLAGFRKHRLGNIGTGIILLFVLMAIGAQFIAPYPYDKQFRSYPFVRPSTLHFRSESGFSLRPYVYALKRSFDPETYQPLFTEDTSKNTTFTSSSTATRTGFWEYLRPTFICSGHRPRTDPPLLYSCSGQISSVAICSPARWSGHGYPSPSGR